MKINIDSVFAPHEKKSGRTISWKYYSGMVIHNKNIALMLAERVLELTSDLPAKWVARKDTRREAVRACQGYIKESDRKELSSRIEGIK